MSKSISISKNTRGGSPKLIVPKVGRTEGLVLVMLTSVKVSNIETTNSDGGWAEFVGKDIPRLEFNFIEANPEKGTKAGLYRYSITPVPHEPNSEKYDWWFGQKPEMLKHFIDAYIGEENFLDEYEALLQLSMDEDKEMPAEEVLARFRKFFEGVVTVFEGDGKKLPCIFKAKDKSIIMWAKLLMTVKNKQVNNGNFGFPGYAGDGVIERYVENVKPSIRIKASKGESIEDVAVKVASSTMPPLGGAVPPTQTGGIEIPNFMDSPE